MRKQLQQAKAGETLRDVLVRIGPQELADWIQPGPGFVFRGGADLAASPVAGRPGRYQLAGSQVVADVRIEYSAELGVAVQTITLTNTGSEPSPTMRELNIVYLPLTVRVKDCPAVHTWGGGLTDGFYPPRAWRPEEVAFGKARAEEDNNPSFTRWWVAQRFVTITSGPNGRSANPHLPLLQADWQVPGGLAGLWAALEWSGRWELQFGVARDWQFCLRGGPKVKDMVLAPGETLALPPVHIGVYGGPGAQPEDGSNGVRRYVAEALCPDVEGRRPWAYVAYNHWFGIEEKVSAEILKPQVDLAARLGLEYFGVDSAWYGGSSENFANGVGNWEREDETKFPGGLKAFADYVHKKGMRFGLWFEPERGRKGSDWVTKHPEWYWDCGNPVNFHLDLTQKVVQDYLIATLARWIEELDIRWLRWDNNQEHGPFWDKVDPTGKVQFAYFAGMFRVWDTLLERYPNLMIDNCAGGGQRTDFATLRRSGTMVISDHAEDPHVCRIMQTGGGRVLPGNLMNSSIYVGEHDPDGVFGKFELMSRMCGSITLAGHIANWPAKKKAMVAGHLQGFRTFRHLLMKDFHALTPYPRTVADWDVAEYVDPASHEAVVLAYRMRGDVGVRVVLPKGLDPDATYELVDPFSGRKPRQATGKVLMQRGLRLALAPDSAVVRHLRPVR